MRRCVLAYMGGCDGPITRHHLFPQRQLRRQFPKGALILSGVGAGRVLRTYPGKPQRWEQVEFPFDLELTAGARVAIVRRSLTALLGDSRNTVDICWQHHQLVEQRDVDVEREQMPVGLRTFATELGLNVAATPGAAA